MKDAYFVLEELARQNRYILSSWRAQLILRHRDNHYYLGSEKHADRTVRKLHRDGLIEPIRGKTLYRVTTPYARKAVNIYELVNEAYPSAIFSHSSALELHRLTDQRSRTIHFYEGPYTPGTVLRQTAPDDEVPIIIPPDTKSSEWRTLPLPRTVRLRKYDQYQFKSHALKGAWVFGYEATKSQGVTVHATDLERTLIDGLRHPKHCGGLNEVFRAWVRAEKISVERLIDYVERIDQLILCQRTGFVMETLGLYHDRLDEWKQHRAPRGGSRVLNPDNEYSSEYSDEWNLSINHPIAILRDRDVRYS